MAVAQPTIQAPGSRSAEQSQAPHSLGQHCRKCRPLADLPVVDHPHIGPADLVVPNPRGYPRQRAGGRLYRTRISLQPASKQ